jgi:hypothetical protein
MSATGFSFNNQDYQQILLGGYDFRNLPKLIPERHGDEIELLATTEHEQIHDLLARQTTHGILVALVSRYLEQSIPDSAKKTVRAGIRSLLDDARFLHEGFAVFNTLRTSHIFVPLLERLSPDYRGYLNEIETILPEKLKNYRFVRAYLYGAVVNILSPTLTPPSEDDPIKAFSEAFNQIYGCRKRWEKLKDKVTATMPELTATFTSIAQDCEVSEEELQLPLDYERFREVLPSPEQREAFNKKEGILIERWTEYLSQAVFPDGPRIATFTSLSAMLRPYRDLLAPNYLLTHELYSELGLLPEQYYRAHRYFQKVIESDIGVDVTFKRQLVTGIEPAVRILQAVLDVLPEPHIFIGVLSTALRFSNNDAIPRDHPGVAGTPYNIKWTFISPNLSDHPRGKIYTLTTLQPTELWAALPGSLKSRLGLILSPGLYHPDVTAKALVYQILQDKGQVAFALPLNFLDYLEWRHRNELVYQPILVRYAPTEIENCFFMICSFAGETIPHYRLVTSSTMKGIAKLQSTNRFDLVVDYMERDDDIERYRDWVNYLRVVMR